MLPYEGVDLDFSLEGKTAVITGGAAGIGYTTAQFFHDKGVNVVLADLNPKLDRWPRKSGRTPSEWLGMCVIRTIRQK